MLSMQHSSKKELNKINVFDIFGGVHVEFTIESQRHIRWILSQRHIRRIKIHRMWRWLSIETALSKRIELVIF